MGVMGVLPVGIFMNPVSEGVPMTGITDKWGIMCMFLQFLTCRNGKKSLMKNST